MNVSVIVPAHNYGSYLGQALRSILAQTRPPREIIIVDDGSTDDTPQVVAAFDDPRIRAVRIAASGVSVARNTGLDMARGEFIAFLDADDRWRPTMLEKTVAVLESEPEVCAVFTDFVRFCPEGEWPRTQFSFMPELAQLASRPSAAGPGRVLLGDAFVTALAMSQYPAYMQATVMRASSLRGLRFPVGVAQSEDLQFMLLVYQKGKAAFVAEPLVEVRRHSNNSYTELRTKGRSDLAALRRVAREPLEPEQRRALRSRIGRAWLGLAYHHYHTRRPIAAAGAAMRALGVPGYRLAAVKRLALLPAMPFLADAANVDWSQAPDSRMAPPGATDPTGTTPAPGSAGPAAEERRG